MITDVKRLFFNHAGQFGWLMGLLLTGCMGANPHTRALRQIQSVHLNPLHLAAMSGDREQVAKLLAEGADVDGRDAIKQTPLRAAASMGCYEVVELLLDKGANINVKDRLGLTPLCSVCWTYWNVQVPRLSARLDYLSAPPGHERPDWGIYGIDAGPYAGKVVKILLDRGADVNLADASGKTPIMYAAGAGWLVGTEALLAKNADVQGVSLHGAVALGLSDLVLQLLAKTPSLKVNAVDGSGRTPLDYAARRGSLETVELLLSKGANVSVGHPMSSAAAGGNLEIVRLLLAKGADINAVVRIHQSFEIPEGATLLVPGYFSGPGAAGIECPMTPLGLAMENGHREVAELLRQRGGKESHLLKSDAVYRMLK